MRGNLRTSRSVEILYAPALKSPCPPLARRQGLFLEHIGPGRIAQRSKPFFRGPRGRRGNKRRGVLSQPTLAGNPPGAALLGGPSEYGSLRVFAVDWKLIPDFDRAIRIQDSENRQLDAGDPNISFRVAFHPVVLRPGAGRKKIRSCPAVRPQDQPAPMQAPAPQRLPEHLQREVLLLIVGS
jgi:hypothetical protein